MNLAQYSCTCFYIILDFIVGSNSICQVAVKAGGLRARALGPLLTPSWGALEPRVDFTVPVEVGYHWWLSMVDH